MIKTSSKANGARCCPPTHSLCRSPGLGPLGRAGTGKILGPCTASAWSWWSRSHRRWDEPSGSPVCPPVRTGSSGCSSPGTRTPTAPRCRSTPRRDWAGCSAAEPWEWAKLSAPSPGRRGARAALWCQYRSVLQHAIQPCFLRLKNAQPHD